MIFFDKFKVDTIKARVIVCIFEISVCFVVAILDLVDDMETNFTLTANNISNYFLAYKCCLENYILLSVRYLQ